MKYGKAGSPISEVEITRVSKLGFWILTGQKERFLSFEQFPWFRNATLAKLLNVTLPSEHHLCWPDLDVDISIDSIDHPDRFPLMSSVTEAAMPSPSPRDRDP